MIVSPQPPCHNRLKSLNSFSVSLLEPVSAASITGYWLVTDRHLIDSGAHYAGGVAIKAMPPAGREPGHRNAQTEVNHPRSENVD